jgi:hypothetical protein
MKTRVLILVVCVLALLITMPVMAQDMTEEAAVARVVQSFYDDYLAVYHPDAWGEMGNPLVNGDYRNSPYLTEGWIAHVDNIMATIENGAWLVDPFLYAQDIPEYVTVEVVDVWAEGANVLLCEHFVGNPRSHNITVLLTRTDGWRIDYVLDEDNVTPAGVVERFYTWYISYAQPNEQGDFINPLAAGYYREYPYLSADLIATVDAQVATGQPLADPFLHAQDFPSSITVDEVSVTDSVATVMVHQWFSGNPTPGDILVHLVRVDRQWFINTMGSDVTPDAVALVFYNGYIAYRRYDIEHEIERRPLVDWASGLERYLGDALREQLAATFGSGAALLADPVLCAQDIPEAVTAEVIMQTDTGATVTIAARYPSGPDSYATALLTTVEMMRMNGQWQLIAIGCS